MITLTLEMDFSEDENPRILQKLSELLAKTDKVKIKELKVGEKVVEQTISYPPLTPLTSPPTYPNITWTCDSSTTTPINDVGITNVATN